MSRLFTRDERRLATAGVLSGILTAALALVLWFRGVGVGPALQPPPDVPADSAGDPFVGALRRDVSARLASRPVSARPLRGELSLRALDITWNVPGSRERWLRARSVTGRLDLAAANRGEVVLAGVRIASPDIRLRSDGRRWNYERPLAGLLEDGGGGRGGGGRTRVFRVEGLAFDDASVNVDMPENDFSLVDATGRLGTLQLSGPGLSAPTIEVVSASATLDPPGERQPMRVAAERGSLRFPNRVTEFELRAVTIAGTRLEELEGSWDPSAPGYGLTATGRAPDVRFADIRFIAPDRIPEEGTASFRFAVAPLTGEGTAVRLSDLRAVSGDSRVGGSLAAEVFPGRVAVERVDLRLEPVSLAFIEKVLGRALPYSGNLTGTLSGPGTDIQVDVVASLRAPDVAAPFNIGFRGGVALTRAGLTLRDMQADLRRVPLAALRPVAPGIALDGFVTGTVALNGSPETTPLQLDVRLELGTGLATVAGTLDLTGAVPSYDVTGRVVGIDLQSVFAPAVPPVHLTASFALAGSGFDLPTANARIRLNGDFTGWRAEAGDRIALVARIAGGTAEVDTLLASLATADLNGSGRWRFVEPLSGAVQYRLTVADLAPFGPYVPMLGDSTATGSLRAEGTVSGPIRALRLAGRLDGENLRVGAWQAARLESEYTVAFTGALPEFELDAKGSEIRTPTFGNYRALTADVRLRTPLFTMDVRGDRVGGGQVAIVAEGTIPREGSRTVNLNRAYFDLAEGRWDLARPARLTWGGDAGLRVADLELRNAQTSGRIALDGVIFPLDRLDAQVAVADLPLEQVQDLLGRPQTVGGRLWADFTVRPPAGSPDIRGTFRLDQASISGVRFTQLEGRLDYANGVARTELLAALDSAAGRLDLRGTLPLRISFADSLQFGFAESGPLDATLRAERITLAPLNAFISRVRDLTGVVDGTVTLGGSVDDPRLGGQLTLSEGSVTVPELNQRYDSIAGTVAFNGRQAELRDIRLHRDGWARLSGTATFEEIDRPVFALVATLEDFQPIGVDQHPDATVSGRVTLDGELDALVLSGNVTIDDGYLSVPQFGRAFEDDLIDIMDPTPVQGVASEQPGQGTWLTNLRIQNLRARFGEGAWFEAMEATAQLSGDLTINHAGDETRIVGTLEGERGTYTLVAGPIVRRFEVTHAQIRFLGEPEPNPAINITAKRVMLDETGRRVEVEVRITGTMQTPRLGLASQDAPDIPQSELLSYLLFGRPTFALGENLTATGTDLLGQTYFGGLAELLGLELERTLSAGLGLQLDLFQVQFGQGLGGITTPTVVVGRQLSNDFFLTLETGLSALFGDEGGATASNWAIRLEWAIDRRSSLRASLEPVNRARLLRGFGAALPPAQASPHQLYVEYRRRWVY